MKNYRRNCITRTEADILRRLLRATAPLHQDALHGNRRSLKVMLCQLRKRGLDIPFGAWGSGTYYLSPSDREKVPAMLEEAGA